MRLLCVLCFTLQLISSFATAAAPTAASINGQLAQISLDPKQTFRVRDLQIVRGDIKIYLTEGVISFLTPLSGKTVAAVFSTQPVEAGDAELIVLPPQSNERKVLASYTKSPNLDEHFDSALFLFSDQTVSELLSDIQQAPVHQMPEAAATLAPAAHNLMQDIGAATSGELVASVLDQHDSQQGFFYALLGGRALGVFDVLYSPGEFEQVTVGSGSRILASGSPFQLWTSFRCRQSPPYKEGASAISDYRIVSDIHSDLSLDGDASFHWKAESGNGRVIPLFITEKLKIDSAAVDGQPVEVFQPSAGQSQALNKPAEFFLITEEPLVPGSMHQVEVRYRGSVIRKTETASYFVDDRNAWYPYTRPTLANFDLTFRCPDRLRLVSTGELLSDTVKDGIRTVHRRTQAPEALAGFNLGDYEVSSQDAGPYRIECYTNKTAVPAVADIQKQLAELLDYYTKRWIPLPIRSIAVSPVPASFGQGFPGLIYLSDVSYIRPEDRPLSLRTPTLDQFFTDLLLPHEVAHQWWGNIVSAAEYRSEWLMEALANYSALQFVEKSHGPAAGTAILNTYRADLTKEFEGKTVETYGPLEFGFRLADISRPSVWHTITYEKGSWVIHMLHQRLGDEGFRKLEMHLLRDFADRPITNEAFREAASAFVPADQPDKNLSFFFETWVYGTGIPKLKLDSREVTVSGVEDDFAVDVPLRCHGTTQTPRTRWVRLSSGVNQLDLGAGAVCELPLSSEFLYR